MHKLDSINYLSSGNTIQKETYRILTDNNIMQYLYDFNPILVGTIPLEIDIDGSDLDIICYWQDKQLFIDVINQCFSEYKDYTLREVKINGYPTVIANFFIENFEIEIFGQNIPVVQQYGYRHMIIEYNILLQKGNEFKNRIIELKKQGYKTEPAFALLLGIKGNDPYKSLLDYEVHKN
ncbi:DUF4269 domain-containing protein [Flavobacterium salilacus subsp. salilacus]|uniref:DUF4269 domain-containing protein n=1 Tax=Flavobacterium TaxID=237 RepID=UPI0010751DCC|nr:MULTISPECIES: DUF4269 domain-containing protein [Flavobacterium]KAF2518715.1 DUF4269 domain-containing protein [Flavobacterium salilacus subsp. salilacus]MBE1613680.1 DUF4269 domain-containing protein [Flavobacterium sp. SaA2.13]